MASSSPIAKFGSVDSGRAFIRSLVGGEGVIRGHIDATSSAKKEFVGDPGKFVELSTRRNPSISISVILSVNIRNIYILSSKNRRVSISMEKA